jgi:hypothetical protein
MLTELKWPQLQLRRTRTRLIYDLHALMIMTYLAVLLYTLLFTKPKQHVIEIIYGRGKFVGDLLIFNCFKHRNEKN